MFRPTDDLRIEQIRPLIPPAILMENLPLSEGASTTVAESREAVARVKKLGPDDLDRSVPFFRGELPIREILWTYLLAHNVHHRGQLSLMCRLAGGEAPGLYGPNREETAKMRAAAGV